MRDGPSKELPAPCTRLDWLRLRMWFLLAFFGLAVLVELGALRPLDAQVMALIKGAESPALDLVAGMMNYLVAAETSVLISLIAAAWLWRRRAPSRFALAPLAWLLSLPLELGLKLTLDQPPPSGDLYRATVRYALFSLKTMQSFPSGHATRAAFFAVFLGLLAGRLAERPWLVQAGLGLVVLVAAWCRVYQGMHWPSDVVGGGLLGAGVGLLAFRALAPHVGEGPRTAPVRGLRGRREGVD